MGRDKLLLEVDGVPLLRRVRDALAGRCAEIIVVGGAPARLAGVRRVSDERPGGLGPLAGIEAGLAAAEHRLVFVAAGDMPFLSADLIRYLLDRLRGGGLRAVAPRHGGGAHPLCAAYDRELLPQVRAALDEGVRSMRGFLESVGPIEYAEDELRRFGDPEVFLMNVNSPEDLYRARTICGSRP